MNPPCIAFVSKIFFSFFLCVEKLLRSDSLSQKLSLEIVHADKSINFIYVGIFFTENEIVLKLI